MDMNLPAQNPTSAIRQTNLLRLIAECGTPSRPGKAADAAKRADKDRRQISAWSLGNKAISDESARELERAFSKPTGWMDREHQNASPSGHIEARMQSQSQRLDLDKMRDAMELARLLAELRDEPEMANDPMYVAYAYEVLVEIDTPLGTSNVLDLTKRLAAKLKGETNAAQERDKAS